MVDNLGWRWEFGVQVPLIAVGVAVSIIAVPNDIGLYGKKKEGFWEAMRAFDFKGSSLMSTSITFLILGLVSLLAFFSIISSSQHDLSPVLDETISRMVANSLCRIWGGMYCRVSQSLQPFKSICFHMIVDLIVGSHPFVIASLAVFAVMFPLFLYVEAAVERPIMPLRFVQKSPHMNLIFSNFIAGLLANAIFFNV